MDDFACDDTYDDMEDPNDPDDPDETYDELEEPEPPRPAPKVKMVKQNSMARNTGRLDLASVLAVPGGGKAHENR